MEIRLARFLAPILHLLDFLTPVGDLLARIWIAYIFFKSGLVKISDFDSTVALFQQVYQVPLMPPYMAAVMATGIELIFPVLLVIGLGGRLMILFFFIYNFMAVISYHYLWTPEGLMGLDQHIGWGLLLALLMFHGPGKLSIDYILRRKNIEHLNYGSD